MLVMNQHWIGNTTQSQTQAIVFVKTDIDKQISLFVVFDIEPVSIQMGRVPYGSNDYGNELFEINTTTTRSAVQTC